MDKAQKVKGDVKKQSHKVKKIVTGAAIAAAAYGAKKFYDAAKDAKDKTDEMKSSEE